MRFTSVSVENFQRIDDPLSIDLAPITLLVGENGSGKSSILKAIHWAVRCATLADETSKVTLEQMDYTPSKEFLDVAHKKRLRSKSVNRKMVVSFVSPAGKTEISLNAASNDAGVKVDCSGPSSATLKRSDKPSTAYIPGLAGLAEEETTLAVPIMHRKAASGEGGSVLRQVLHQLSGVNSNDYVLLDRVSELVSAVFPGTRIWVKFDSLRDRNISVKFMTPDMRVQRQRDDVSWRPLEMAGTGYLQVIQIFSYLLYFEPALVLIDEPDAHLHPSSQRALMRALQSVAAEFPQTQFIISTHSPTMVQAASGEVALHWIDEGTARQHGEIVKEKMGWSLLDKEILIFSEDGSEKWLRKILSQWPEIDEKCAVWPVFGVGALPSGDKLRKIEERFGVKALIHRDRDFMSDSDICHWLGNKGYGPRDCWVTSGSDIEAEFLSVDRISSVLKVSSAVVDRIFDRAMTKMDLGEIDKQFASAYQEATQKIGDSKRKGIVKRLDELTGRDRVKGKTLAGAMKSAAREVLAEDSIGDSLHYVDHIFDTDGNVAQSLRDFLNNHINNEHDLLV